MKKFPKVLALPMTAAMIVGMSLSVSAMSNTTIAYWNFDDGASSFADWTLIDADGDGWGWQDSNSVADNGGWRPTFGESFRSASWIFADGALTPDNWAITPALELGNDSSVSFYAWGSYFSTPKEHFALYIGKTPDISAMTQVSGEEITAFYNGDNFYEYDISKYDNQTVYLALRHFNCTDQDSLLVDDFTVSSLPRQKGFAIGLFSFLRQIRAAETENGKVEVSRDASVKGRPITVTVTPDEGYALDTLSIVDADGNELAYEKLSETEYQFTMVMSNIMVNASFAEIAPVEAAE